MLAGCGGAAAPPRAPDATATATAAARRPPAARLPALCGAVRATVTGHVAAQAAIELSGLALSRTQPGVLWTHNDSGDRARVLAITRAGRLLADVAITGAEAVDWEDISVGPAPGGGDALYIADIGDNDARRAEVVVYRVAEPRVGGGGPAASAPAARLALRYPDGPHDAEALLVDRPSRALVIVTKSFGGESGVYVAAHASTTGTTLLRRRGRLSLGAGAAVTAGDVSADGRTIALRTYDRALVWTRRPGESIAQALRRRPCSPGNDLFVEGQGEALALGAHGRSFYTVPEGPRPAIRRYTASGRVRVR
ncbi:MAG TPA: hypothetical protein VL120_07760 [Solirubrobacteraceae bacterium]|nr:hypothetical protein [Solirubrobacteraceae bacterium]